MARLLGVSQPNVWHWLNKAERVPAEYVLKIEQATGGKVSRHDLRPDIYPRGMIEAAPAQVGPIGGEDRARADCYCLLGRLLAAPPSREVLAAVARLLGGPGELGAAIDAVAAAARATDVGTVEQEYNDLFIGLARGELMPFASYYRTGFLYDKPLVTLRADMERLGIAQAEGAGDPEDHVGALAEMMAGLILGAFGAPVPLAEQRRFFDTHLAPWAGRFFADLERAEAARFYRPVGTFGRLFVAIEIEGFALAA